MLNQTKDAIRAVMAVDQTITPDVAAQALAILEGKDTSGIIRNDPIGRILSREDVARIIGKSVKAVDLYGRRGIFRRVRLTKGRKSAGYSEQSVREAIEGGAIA